MCLIIISSIASTLSVYVRGLLQLAKLLELTIKHCSWPISTNVWIGVTTTTYRRSQGSTKASGLFFGPLVSFDTVSDPRKGSQSLVIWPYKSKIQAPLPKHTKFSNTTSMGKNRNLNQMRGCFTIPPPSLFFKYAFLSELLRLGQKLWVNIGRFKFCSCWYT
jgi:hypothetical protein